MASKSKIITPSQAALTKFEEGFATHFGTGVLRRTDRIDRYETISTGSLALDVATGVGGYVEGRIHEIWGPESTGKSTKCLNAVREAQAKHPDKAIGYIDMEQALDAKWARDQGVDLRNMYHYQPDKAEDVADAAEQMMMAESRRGKGLFSMVLIDSVGGMISEAEWEKAATEDTVAEQARIITRMVKKAAVTARRLGTTVIIVNQVRANISKYGGDTTTGGGWALKHATTMKFRTRKVDSIMEKIDGVDQEVALKIAVMIEKNKVGPARKSAELIIANQPSKISPTIGLVRFGDAVVLGTRYGLIGKAGAWYTLPGHEKGLQGQAAVEEYLRGNPEESDSLWKAVVEKAATPYEVEAGPEMAES